MRSVDLETNKQPRNDSRWRIPLTAAAILVGISSAYALPTLLQTGWASYMKVTGRAEHCDWGRVARFYVDISRFADYKTEAEEEIRVIRTDPDWPLDLIESPYGPMWIRRGSAEPGIAWIFAEYRWINDLSPDHLVRQGDTVLDVGAHVGVFTFEALKRGAARVVAVEPDPVNIECLRRNFEEEIREGRVSIFEGGAWSKTGTFTLHLGDNSAWNSMTETVGGESIEVPTAPIDDIVQTHGLDRVDFIKMDIEGAEKEALRGAERTLAEFSPRVAIDTYQWPHDLPELHALVDRGSGQYEAVGGPCEPSMAFDVIVPHITFYEAAD